METKQMDSRKMFRDAPHVIAGYPEFIACLSKFQDQVYKNACDHGWYDNVKEVNVGEKIALMHCELSETTEAYRQGNPKSEKIGNTGHTQAEEELADCIIRILDFAGHFGLNIASAMVAKHEYNKNRPYKHGKLF